LPIQIQVSDAPLTSDAGLWPLRQFDERIGLTGQFAAVLDDPRAPDLIDHSFTDTVRRRIFGIRAGYEDQNDHDTLGTDPVFKLLADRSPTDADLASQPTRSCFENRSNLPSRKRLREVFVDQFIASFAQPPLALTVDLDAVDDPTHGAQRRTLFHAFYEQYQYLPLVITSAETVQVVMVSLRHGTAAARRQPVRAAASLARRATASRPARSRQTDASAANLVKAITAVMRSNRSACFSLGATRVSASTIARRRVGRLVFPRFPAFFLEAACGSGAGLPQMGN
jgi:hypothetical protein